MNPWQEATGRRGRPRTLTGGVLQVRRATQDMAEVATQYSCSRCQISYYAPNSETPKCPLCTAERREAESREALMAMRNKVELLQNQNRALSLRLDIFESMRDAVSMVTQDDRIFLKSVLYRYRSSKSSLALAIVHRSEGDDLTACGFLVHLRNAEPETYTFESVGGLALVSFYEEANKALGAVEAMTMLSRAIGPIVAEDKSMVAEWAKS